MLNLLPAGYLLPARTTGENAYDEGDDDTDSGDDDDTDSDGKTTSPTLVSCVRTSESFIACEGSTSASFPSMR